MNGNDFPPPYHVCEASRTLGTFLWFTSDHGGEEVPLATSRDILTFVNTKHPRSIFMLSTMRTVVREWNGPNAVCMAVIDPMYSVNGRRRRRVLSLPVEPGARLRVYGFVIGGCVESDIVIPPNHGVEDGCIPFEIDLFENLIINLPRFTN